MTDYTREQFADDVRADRLNSLIRWTLIGCGLGAFLLFNIALIGRQDIATALVPVAILAATTAATNVLKRDARYATSATFYLLGVLLALASLLFVVRVEGRAIAPFAFPLYVFVVGTLFPPARAFMAAVAATVLIIGIGALREGIVVVSWVEVSAIALGFGAAGIAALVTADLYQVAEWAMFNYSRERRVAGELFENRVELERSLSRTRALSDSLQETNVELDAARAAAEEAKHFRGQFLANMSHELRTPLNAIIGFSETMLKYPAMYDGVRLPNAYEGDLSQIYTSGQELLKLINDILDMSKVDAGKLDIRIAPFELSSLVAHVTRTASGLVAQKPVQLVNEVTEDLPLVLADDARVRQVLFNLYSNAAKFTDSGTITVRAEALADDVQISVTDTGSGIGPENHQVIFEEFKQAETEGRDPRSGAGLGLAISRQLLSLMGGRIWVESALGEGSTFFFTIPRATSDRALQPPPSAGRAQSAVVLENS